MHPRGVCCAGRIGLVGISQVSCSGGPVSSHCPPKPYSPSRPLAGREPWLPACSFSQLLVLKYPTDGMLAGKEVG